MSDNELDVAGFESTAGETPLVVEHSDGAPNQVDLQKVADKNQIILQLIEANRTKGLERLLQATSDLQQISAVQSDPKLEGRLREIEAGLRGAATLLEATDNLINIIKQDLVSTIVNLEKFSKVSMHQGMHLQTLMELLQRKEMINAVELEETWKSLVPSEKP